jgi:prepilin-type N-terminal cleavage/methylation domain-containing protein
MKTVTNKGFTLIELMIVVVIIAILAALMLGSFNYMQKKAIDVKCQAQFAAVELAIESYKTDHGFYPMLYKGSVAAPGGKETYPDHVSYLKDRIAYMNDQALVDIPGKTSKELYRALVWKHNSFSKAYLNDAAYSPIDGIGHAGIRKAGFTNGAEEAFANGRFGTVPGSDSLLNPSGSTYCYTYPGIQNKNGFDLTVFSELGKTYRNYRLSGDQ